MNKGTDASARNAEYRERNRASDEQRERQTEALEAAGFAPAFDAEGFMGLTSVQFTFCRKCGAAVPLTPVEDGELHPLDLHVVSHRATR